MLEDFSDFPSKLFTMSDYSSDDEQRTSRCQVCNLISGRDHEYSDVHRENVLLSCLLKYRKPLSKDRNDITITVSTDYRLPSTGQILNIKLPNKKGQFISTISEDDLSPTNGITYIIKMFTKKPVYLMKCQLLRDAEYFRLIDINASNVREYTANSSSLFPVTLRTDVASIYRTLIDFQFQTIDNKTHFNIIKEMVVNVVNDLEITQFEKSAFTSKKWDYNNIVDSMTKPFLSNAYSIPFEFTQLFNMAKGCFAQYQLGNADLMLRIKSCIDSGAPTQCNYRDFFKYLLWLDEMGARIKIKRYNMEEVSVSVRGQKVILKVIGLAEKRPSLVGGDFVLMHFPGTSIAYRGVIQNVLDKEIEIKDFNPQFLHLLQNPNVVVNVEFEIGRLTYVRMHTALDKVDENLLQLLFPERNISYPTNQTYVPVNNIYNPLIRKNEQQVIAIENIIKRSFGRNGNRAPYIVFGPPGTGKTVTIIEAIRQIFRRTGNSKVLICAPTNAACDNIAEKLVDYFTTEELLRYISVERQFENMSDRVKQYTNKGKVFVNDFKKYKIIICTLIKIGSFTAKYEATNVFIDEAGQALEPEALVAISGILSKNGVLVLSGDPKQLEPMCSSSFAERKGLSKSLICRLLDMPTYQLNRPDSHLFITKLLLNYRNHEDILKLPNELFYGGELKPVSKYPVNDFINKIFIPVTAVNRNNFMNRAIEFCGVSGEDERRGKSPSYFNTEEIDMVVKYIECLIGPDCNKIPPKDIGVITPYKRQCILIQNKIRSKLNIDAIDVGSTEAFQGKEKRIIIISTVRARADLLLHDRKYNIGFVNNEKRFNVAITRAISKLIVVGNPVCLYTNDNWAKLINLCKEMKSYRGYKYNKKTTEESNQITGKLRTIDLLKNM